MELLVGQVAVVNLQVALAGVQESLTVTAESPLIDVSQSRINGRSWASGSPSETGG